MEMVMKQREGDWVTLDMKELSRRDEKVECFENANEETVPVLNDSELLCSRIIAETGFIRLPCSLFNSCLLVLLRLCKESGAERLATGEGFGRGFC